MLNELRESYVHKYESPIAARAHYAVLDGWADEILGVWEVNGRTVELSEVTMPNLTSRNGDRVRYIGVTFGTGAESEGALVANFAQLEKLLGLVDA